MLRRIKSFRDNLSESNKIVQRINFIVEFSSSCVSFNVPSAALRISIRDVNIMCGNLYATSISEQKHDSGFSGAISLSIFCVFF